MEDDKKKPNQHYSKARHSSLRFLQQCCCVWFSIVSVVAPAHSFDYADALSKSLLYFESRRSGRLPYDQRVTWRHHSGLTDGLEQGVSTFLDIQLCKVSIFNLQK